MFYVNTDGDDLKDRIREDHASPGIPSLEYQARNTKSGIPSRGYQAWRTKPGISSL